MHVTPRPESTVDHDEEGHIGIRDNSQVPPGWLPDNTSTVKPMRRKEIANIAKSAVSAYDSFDETRKYAMCEVMLKLQEIVLSDKATESTNENSDGVVVAVPHANEVRKQTRKRLMPATEHAKRKAFANKHVTRDPKAGAKMMCTKISGTKINKRAQRAGLSQDIHEGNYVAEVKPRGKGTCQFCGSKDGHRYPTCRKRETAKLEAMEYLITSDRPEVATSLQNRLKLSMPIAEKVHTGKCIGRLTDAMDRANFVIHMASEAPGANAGSIESCNYCDRL